MEREYPSDTDRTRSASPPNSVYNTNKKVAATPNMRINTLLNEEPASTPISGSKGPGRGNWSRNRNGGARAFKARLDAQGDSQDGQSPSAAGPPPGFTGPHGFYLPLNGSDPSHKRTRPLTQHQLAVEQYRRRRVEVILDRGIRMEYKRAQRRRRQDGSFMRAWVRCKGVPEGYDTDEELNAQVDEHGVKDPPAMLAGLTPLDFGGELNDHGEEAYYRSKMLTRAIRRLERWDGGKRSSRPRKKVNPDVAWMDTNGHGDDDDERDDYSDEEMQDVEDLRREEEGYTEDEDEEERERQDAYTLPPLGHMVD